MGKWVLYVLAGLVGLILLVAIIGFMLPQQHEAWRSVTFRAAPAQVFAIVTDFAKYPEWRTDVTRVDVTAGDGGKGPLVTEHGGNGVIPFRVELMEAPSRLVMRIADPNLSFGGTWTFEISPNDRGADLVLTENGEVYNPIFRVMQKLFFSPYKTLDTYIADLRKRLGE